MGELDQEGDSVKIQSTVTGQSWVWKAPGDTDEMLFLLITVDCPICGPHKMLLNGHHLRAIRNLLAETIDHNPTACGDESGVRVLNRMKFEGQAPEDPERN